MSHREKEVRWTLESMSAQVQDSAEGAGVAGCMQGNDPAGVDARRHAAATEPSDWLEWDGDIIQTPLELITLSLDRRNCTLEI